MIWEAWEDEAAVRSCSLVYLCRCGGRPLRPEGWYSMATHPSGQMMIPAVVPIVVPLPSLGHRQFCVAGLARKHPDSGGADIMGVPLPHLVLPLSGCLSRRAPTRATRGEARGHRSVLAQNPLLMHTFLFPSFGLVVGLVDMWVAERSTAQLPWLCVLCVHRLAVWV